MNGVIVSDSPHIRKRRTTRGIMADVCIALVPSAVAGCVFFGLKALLVLAITCATCLATEFVYSLCLKKKPLEIVREFDFTSLVTGLLLGLVLSPAVPWYVPLTASVFAVAVVKMLFGGTGKNIVNPAITGRIFAFIAFAVAMNTWAMPAYGALGSSTVTTGATPLTGFLNGNGTGLGLLDMFLGTGMPGCIGETCKPAILLGFAYLIIRRVVDPRWPIIYVLSTGIFAVCFSGFDIGAFMPSILSGGLLFGAVFMATDYVTSPRTNGGRYLYYLLLGLVTAALRAATHIEVVSFAILLMNLLVPLINKLCKPRPFGSPKLSRVIKDKLARGKKKEA